VVALLLAVLLGYVGYLAIALGPRLRTLTATSFLRGYERILEPAELRGRALRGPGDRVYLLTTQSERIVPVRFRHAGNEGRARRMLHVDLWAFDARAARPVWKKRVRTFEDGGAITFELLGLDGGTLWLFVREPIAVAAADGTIIADGARLEAQNPPLAGKRIDEHGYVAFGGQGLQLTLTDSTQWAVDGALHAERRETAPAGRPEIVLPAPEAASTDRFKMRGLRIGETAWLGVLTDDEAKRLGNDPVVPGRDPSEPRGVMYDFLAAQHVPGDLHGTEPLPYRLWSATVKKVSAAPRDWPKELPDRWGTRDEFSDYKALPEAPGFLRAGLLGDGTSPNPFWVRDPDSVVVLYHDKLGPTGRVHVARVTGPTGKVAWDTALPIADVSAALFGPEGQRATSIAFVGSEPNPAYDRESELSRERHEKVVAVDVASGAPATFDLTERSVAEAVD
jgi:hypothetical protein